MSRTKEKATNAFRMIFFIPMIFYLFNILVEVFRYMNRRHIILTFSTFVTSFAGKEWRWEGSRFRASNSTFCYEDGIEVGYKLQLQICLFFSYTNILETNKISDELRIE
jgi:hypothetical protein